MLSIYYRNYSIHIQRRNFRITEDTGDSLFCVLIFVLADPKKQEPNFQCGEMNTPEIQRASHLNVEVRRNSN